MARLARLVMPGQVHLLVQRSRDGSAVFGDDVDRRSCLDALAQALRETGVGLHGFGLLAAEVRLLVTPPGADALAALVQAVGRRFVRAYNLRHARAGTPWEGRFRSTVVESPACVIDALRYVEGLEDGAAAAAASGAWSSQAHHLGQRRAAVIAEHAAYWALGNTPFEREAAYRAIVEAPLAAAVRERIRDAAIKGWVLGSASFAAEVGEATGRRATPLSRGRPRKPVVQSATGSI